MQRFLALLFLITLFSCGQDVSSNRKLATVIHRPTEGTTPEIGQSGSSVIFSQIHREKGQPVLTYAQEISQILNNTLSGALYRIIPSVSQDDEGSIANVVTVNDLGRPNTNCGSGTEFTGISARMNDCQAKNPTSGIWEGGRNGSAGEGTWRLVARNETAEYWLDERTGLLWSHFQTETNWCKASGNTEADSSLNTINCSLLGENQSVCAGASFAEIPATEVKWRLPTRNDYLQADLDGLRFVLMKENPAGLWTATIRSASGGRSEAWVYHSTEGTITSANLSTAIQVRCVGAAVL